ncbi:hypothetical protein C882_0883 [Caenispirillum salinarum AK4]|uniref:TadE-like domain-containing protein n=1 Tax=Caenispirillum salinarum AK4 TaxID=1238182 RepID=K9HJA7_9PROT|nr:TadE family protein [Caenispirillum salinarum]EKV28671.1 hypothetical protein C882_0883 [Caenispirillum salinarum AK4]
MRATIIHKARRLGRDERGTAILEFTLVAMILFSITFAIVDFAIAFWQANLADKATYQGTRQAVQSDPVAPGLVTWSGVVDGGLVPGQSLDLTTLDTFTVRCQGGACACTGPGCGTLGDPGYDATAFNRVLAAVQMLDGNGTALFPRATADNVYIEYTHVGQGFAGRPGSDIVPLVSVGVQGLVHPFYFMGAFGVSDLTIGDSLTTLPAEDLSTAGPG